MITGLQYNEPTCFNRLSNKLACFIQPGSGASGDFRGVRCQEAQEVLGGVRRRRGGFHFKIFSLVESRY